jgi:hypothetical protein
LSLGVEKNGAQRTLFAESGVRRGAGENDGSADAKADGVKHLVF